jgi:peptidyl-prolyl cis-trans isomerase D
MALAVMRRHRRWLFVFLWLVIAAFIILYIPAFQGADAGSPGETMARVGGLPITVGEFRKSYLRQRQRLEQLYQGRLDAEALRSMGIEEQVFNALVDDRLVALEVKRLGLSIDDETLAREVAHRFQENGRYIGSDEIRRRLELQGGTVDEFEQSLRDGLLRERLERLVTDGVAVTPAEAEREFRRRTEQVKTEYVLVDAAPFRATAAVTDDEVGQRFQSDRESYRIPEQRVVQYLVVDETALSNRVAVTDAEMESHYQEHKEDFKEPEEVCASHILVKVKASPEGEGHPDAEARKTAEGLLAQVKAGADFAALAKKSSEDKGSATMGGDVGCFGRGHMVPPFENAAFSMKAGDFSALVKTDFGYHIIKIDSRREETTPALSQVKDRIRQTLLSQRARALVEEKMAAVVAALRRGRGLEEAAREQGLPAKRSEPFARGETAPAPLSSPQLVARVFELKSGQVEPEPFSIPGGYVFVALAEVRAPRVPDLPEARARVKADLVEEKALQAARARAAEVKVRAEKDGLEKAASALGLVRKETAGLVGRGQPLGDMGTGAALEDAAFSLPQGSLSDPVRTSAGYAVLRVLERKPFDPAAYEGQKATIVASLKDQRRQQLFRAYLAQARQRYTVERRPEAFQRVMG